MFVIAIACDQFEAIFSDETLVRFWKLWKYCINATWKYKCTKIPHCIALHRGKLEMQMHDYFNYHCPGWTSKEARSFQTEETKTCSFGRGEKNFMFEWSTIFSIFTSFGRVDENLSLFLVILQLAPSHNWFLFLRFADEVTPSSGSSPVTLGTSSPSSRSSTTQCSGFCHRLSGCLSSTVWESVIDCTVLPTTLKVALCHHKAGMGHRLHWKWLHEILSVTTLPSYTTTL